MESGITEKEKVQIFLTELKIHFVEVSEYDNSHKSVLYFGGRQPRMRFGPHKAIIFNFNEQGALEDIDIWRTRKD